MYNQSSLTNSKGSGPINAVDGNVLTSSITNNGLNEFWWGMFDAPHKISSLFVVVGKGNVILFLSLYIYYIIHGGFRQLIRKNNDFIS